MPIRRWRRLAFSSNGHQFVAGEAIAAAYSSGIRDEFSGNAPARASAQMKTGGRLAARLILDRRYAAYGVTSPRPTLMRAVSNVPSGFFTALVILILAPGFSSLL